MSNIVTADTSAMVDYLKGIDSKETRLIEELFNSGNVMLPPMVISELLSSNGLTKNQIDNLRVISTFEIKRDYWVRVGFSRAKILSKKLKARMLDVQIAQICIDYDAEIIVKDSDFRHFKKYLGLKIYDFK